MTKWERPLAAAAAVAAAAWSFGAEAHVAGGVPGGFAGGLAHPLTGPDHFLAMLAVGIWGAQMGGRAVWRLPVAFPLVLSPDEGVAL